MVKQLLALTPLSRLTPEMSHLAGTNKPKPLEEVTKQVEATSKQLLVVVTNKQLEMPSQQLQIFSLLRRLIQEPRAKLRRWSLKPQKPHRHLVSS